MDISIVSLIATLIVAATPILLAATGELISFAEQQACGPQILSCQA